MKAKVQKIVLLVGMLWIAMLAMAGVYAAYPVHLGGNPNYILCDAHMGVAWYVDRSSLVVQKYAPPQYIIAVNVVRTYDADKGSTVIQGVDTKRFFYNIDLQQMYVDRNGTDNWHYLDPNGSWAATGVSMPAGEIAFALAYGMQVYGIYDNSFYSRI